MAFGNLLVTCFGHREDLRRNSMDVVSRLKDFMENEARSCSMDFGCITPLYVFRMWGGSVALEEIETAFQVVKKQYDY